MFATWSQVTENDHAYDDRSISIAVSDEACVCACVYVHVLY